jgi:tRNA acetyltransferase TAN1
LHLQFYEDLVDGKGSSEKPKSIPDKPMNKNITFDSDSSDDEDEDHAGEEANEDHVGEEANKDHAGEEANKDHAGEEANKDHAGEEANKNHAGEEADNGNDAKKGETTPSEPQQEVLGASGSVNKDDEEQVDDADASKPKKPRVEDPPVSEQADQKKSTDKPKEPADKPKESTEKNIDDLIDEDLKELGDRKKVSLRSENNYIFIIYGTVLISAYGPSVSVQKIKLCISRRICFDS